MDLERHYRTLPVPAQHLACSVVGGATRLRRYNRQFLALLNASERRLEWSHEEVVAYRDRRLAGFVRHAAETSRFWQRRFGELGVDARDIRTADDLAAALPVLTKDEVREHAAEIVSTAVPPRDRLMVHTSGTTGAGLRFPASWLGFREQWALWWRHWRYHGVRLHQDVAWFGGRNVVPLDQQHPPYWRYNLPGRQLLLSGYHMSPDKLDAYADELRRRRPSWFHGYPSLIALLASHLVESGATLGYRVEHVTTGAENLTENQKSVIERAFGTAPVQHYGLTEGTANASECMCGNLHVDEDFCVMEFVDDHSTPGTSAVVGTNISNPAFPLLRLTTGDVGVVSGGGCTCSRPGRVVDRVDGRREDALVLADGSRVFTLNHVFKDAVNVREAQIYQPAAGEVTLRVVPADTYGPGDDEALLREARIRLGDDTVLRIEHWEKLPRTATGKLRMVVSDVGRRSEDVGDSGGRTAAVAS